MSEELEKLQMQLAACGVAALSNTRESAAAQRIGPDNQYWSASYGDVCKAVDREMDLREKLEAAAQRLKKLDALEAGGVDNWEWYGDSLRDAGLLDEDEDG